MQNYY